MKSEEALAILLGRLSFDKYIKVRIFHLVKNGIDWYEFLNICVRKKLICLAYQGLRNLGLIQLLPMIVLNNMQYHYEQNRKQNEKFIQASSQVITFLKQANILAMPVKGLRFLDTIYQREPEVRILNDIDFVVSNRHYEEVHEFMIKNMFKPYLSNNRDILCFDSKKIESCFYVHFDKEDPYGKVRVDFDFSYHDKWIELIKDENDPIYEFLYLCHEYYKETVDKVQMQNKSSYNYVKLIDIREYYLKYLQAISQENILSYATIMDVRESVLFTTMCLKNLYPDIFQDYKEV